MTKTMKYIVSVVAVVVAIAIYGAYLFTQSDSLGVATPSTASTTNSTAKIASIAMTPSTSNASSSSLYNSDATDRIIESAFVTCSGVGTSLTYLTGAGLAGWQIKFATSSNGIQTGNLNQFVMGISTSTPDVYNYTTGTTTPLDYVRVWAAGSYLVPTFNATNTAACTAGVHYLSS